MRPGADMRSDLATDAIPSPVGPDTKTRTSATCAISHAALARDLVRAMGLPCYAVVTI